MKIEGIKVVFLFCSCFIWSVTMAQDVVPNVWLSGKLLNLQNNCEVEDMSDIGRLSLANQQNFFLPDSAGNFSIAMYVDKPGYFRIGRNIVYLSPGDSIEMVIDHFYPEKAVFSGDAAAENMYLRQTTYPKSGSYCVVDSVMSKSYSETIVNIVAHGKMRQAILDKTVGLPEAFVRLETARIQADIINSFFSLSWYFPAENGLSADAAKEFQLFYIDKVDSLIAPYAKGFVSADFLLLVVYQRIGSIIAKHNKGAEDDALRHIKSWMAASNMYAELTSPKRERNPDAIAASMDAIAVPEYRDALVSLKKILASYGVGDPAADFVAEDFMGSSVKLTNLNGKIILIDVWASWCGPCIEAFPQIEKLKEFFKTDSSVIVLSLSIDDNKEKWRKAASKYGITELSWIADRAILEPYRVAAIPRIILIDTGFKIHSFTGLQPEDFNGMKMAIMEIKQTTMGN